MKRITIHDVAAAAGVHRSTVSRVMTNFGSVSRKNREKVLAAAKALNYHPDTLAGSLKSKRKNTWGFLSSWIYTTNSLDHFYSKSLGGLLDAANRDGMRLLLQNVVGRFDESEECLRFCNDSQLGGLVVLAPRSKEPALSVLKRLHAPVVLLAYRPQDPELSFVDLDNAAGARMVVEHLASKGHRRIAYIGGELELSANARDRYNGYLQALQQLNLPADGDLIRNESFEPAFAVASLDAFLALPANQRPSAVFCATDPMARAVVVEAQRRGLSVPHDLAVAGFDNNPFANMSKPSLTTVDFPFFEAGVRAGQILHELSQGSPGPVRELLAPKLMVGEST
jgi:DNA-binding LacI/PurR family transcriptional regulator